MLGHKSTSWGSADASTRPQMRDYKPSDHPSFHRLPLKRRAFVKVTGEGGKKKIFCDFNALYCVAQRGRTERGGEANEERQRWRRGAGGSRENKKKP